MNLSEKLTQHAKGGGKRCSLCEYLDALPTKDAQDEWNEALANPRFSHDQFVRLLQAEGVDTVRRASVGNHRRGGCKR